MSGPNHSQLRPALASAKMEATPAAQGRGHGPLLLLPAEIRNTIYTYVFAETARLDQFGAIVDPDCARPFTSYDLALVNRQTHNDTKEMYYEAQLGRECFTKPHSSYISALKMYRSLSKPLQARMQSLEFFCRPISDPEWFTHTLKGAPGLLSNGKGADWQRVYEELTAASYKDHKTSKMTYWTRKCITLRRAGCNVWGVEIHDPPTGMIASPISRKLCISLTAPEDEDKQA